MFERYTAAGSRVFTKIFGGSAAEYASAIVVEPLSGVVFMGMFCWVVLFVLDVIVTAVFCVGLMQLVLAPPQICLARPPSCNQRPVYWLYAVI